MPAPAVVRSKGPNGTHWFSNTPWWGDVGNSSLVPNVVECDPTIASIEAAVDTATKAKVDAGMVILVRPGTIVGGATSAFATGAAITPKVALNGKGSSSWAKKLLIWPKNGYGSVRVNGQITIESATKIVWAGMSSFDPNNSRRYTRDGYNLNNCNDFGWGWCETGSIRVNANAGRTVKNIELKEFGWPEKITREGDYAGLGVNNTATVDNILMEGFFLPPCYHLITVPWKNNAISDAHSDSQQIQNGPNVTNVVYRDFFSGASTNTAFQNGGYPNLLFDNGQVAGSKDLATRIWPFENNEATDGNHQSLNGSGSLVSVNVDFIGGVHSAEFLPGTTGTKITYDWTGATKGRVTVDKSMASRTVAQVFAISPQFTPARQAQIFGGTYTPPNDTTPPSTPVLNVPVISGRDVQLSWSASTDNIAVQEYIILRGTTSANAVEIDRTSDVVYTDPTRPFSSSQVYLIKAVDTVGLQSPVSNARTATIGAGTGDTVKPTVSILSPTAGSPVSGTVIVQVQAADNVAVTEVSLWSGAQKLPGTFTKTSGDVWEGRLDSTKFPDGTYPIEAHAIDSIPNEGISDTVNVTISNFVRPPDDTTPPSAPVISSITANSLTTAVALWTESVDQNGGVVKYRLIQDGTVRETEITDLGRTITQLDPKQSHTVVIEAYDSKNNTAASDPYTFNTWAYDTTGPTITLQSPAAGQVTGAVQFRYEVTDAGSGVKLADVYFGDELAGIGASLSGDTWGFDTTATELPTGSATWRVKAIDNANNTVWSEMRAITVPAPEGPDTTPSTGGVIDPPSGTVVVPPFQRVRFSASDPHSGISSVSLRTSTLGELATATLVSPGIYEADLPVGSLPYGTTAVFARIINGAGLVYDSTSINLIRETPAVTEQGYVEIAPPILNTAGEPVQNGRLTVTQRVRFGNLDGFITKAPIAVEVTEGLFRIDGVTKNIRVAIPPLDKGLEIIEEGSDLPYVKRIVGFPEGTTDGDVIPYKALVDLVALDQASDASVPPGVNEAIAAAAQVAADRAYLEAAIGEGFIVIRDTDGVYYPAPKEG